MICSICGREFGPGTNCQHCGADRVSAGASYNGYSAPSSSSSSGLFIPNDPAPSHSSSTNTVCPFCGEVIPADAKYCPVCARPLFAACPKCGNIYPSRYKICPSCGTDREKYSREKAEEEMRRAEEKRQAELQAERERAEEERRRIAREALERERKRNEELERRKKEEEKIRKEQEFQDWVKTRSEEFLSSQLGKSVLTNIENADKSSYITSRAKFINSPSAGVLAVTSIFIIAGIVGLCNPNEYDDLLCSLGVGIPILISVIVRLAEKPERRFDDNLFWEKLTQKANSLPLGEERYIMQEIVRKRNYKRILIEPRYMAVRAYAELHNLWKYKD